MSALLSPLRLLFMLCVGAAQTWVAIYFTYAAYSIRLYPIKDYGKIIHEFDPWFNYRATEYLAEHGLEKFFKWYDYESWYPLGRPIGTTIYPGMQMTAVAIWEGMKKVPATKIEVPRPIRMLNLFNRFLQKKFSLIHVPYLPKVFEYEPMSLNDICCMMPPWFGAIASAFTGLLCYEITRNVNMALLCLGVMAIIPAHLMRSVGGEFDNEAVAMAAIVMTFWLWLRSVRTPQSWPIGVFAGLSYVYMVAAWGGYIFVLNMIGIHALMLVGLGRFNSGVHKAYTLFFTIGTFGAMQVPVVGWTPLRSLEQLGPLLVLFGYQVLAFCDFKRRSTSMTTKEFVRFRITTVMVLIAGLIGVAVLLWPTGYFGPLSSRIRGLFVKHTKTGNPLVDSVAEHQPASAGTYQSMLNLPLDYWFLGGLVVLWNRTQGCYFTLLYGFIAAHFSGKMSRLVLICAPIVSIACGAWCGFLVDFLLRPFFLLLGAEGYKAEGYKPEETVANGHETTATTATKAAATKGKAAAAASSNRSSKKEARTATSKAQGRKIDEDMIPLEEHDEDRRPGGMAQIKRKGKAMLYSAIPEALQSEYYRLRVEADRGIANLAGRAVVSVFLAFMIYATAAGKVDTFIGHCDMMGQQMGNPIIVRKINTRDGRQMILDDYLRGYEWIDQNTPKDARVMAWWDYGYQITGIARRTSIADGNTWNHEHIATLGRTLTSTQKKSWNAIRHLADYVLVWAGGSGDDLAKSPHLARIGNSVFPDHCGDDDPKCNKFSFYQDGSPTPMMQKSLLYNLCQNGINADAKVNPQFFEEVHTTRHGLMRVYKVLNVSKTSKEWIANPANRVCDAPGSWYCVGQYPPAIKGLIDKRRNFDQVEDFNKKGGKSAYTKMIEKERGEL